MSNEIVTEAMVLDRENLGEMDSRIYLFTPDFGKIAAKAKSSRKIISKLSAHIEPLNLISCRLIFKKDFQIVDALRMGRLTPNFLKVLKLVNQAVMENQPEPQIWQLIKVQYNSPQPDDQLAKIILNILGFGPEYAVCQSCHQPNPSHFLFSEAQYLCGSCLMHYNYKNKDVFAI